MLTLWKRHSPTCLKTLTKIDLEQRRFHKKCRCACWVTGTHPITGQYLKQSLNTTNWGAAEKLVYALEIKAPGTIEKEKVTIEEALKTWLADKRRLQVSEHTLETMYHAFAAKVLGFALERGITLLSQLNDSETYQLVMSPAWNDWAPATRARHLTNLKAFFKFAQQRKWITDNPADRIDRPKPGKVQVDPYTPEEENRLEVAFRNQTARTYPKPDAGAWARHPETLLCLKHVLEDTALRISDAQRIHPGIIEELPSGDGECTLVQTKLDGEWSTSDRDVTVYLKPETIAEMKRVPWLSEKYPFLRACKNENDRESFKRHLTAEGQKVYYAMQLVGKSAGVEDCRPHRFRHTFAVKHLLAGWPLEKVSRLLGHKNVQTTERYYAKWTKGRQQQLRDEVVDKREEERATLAVGKNDVRSSKEWQKSYSEYLRWVEENSQADAVK